jgi:hypothetical protein
VENLQKLVWGAAIERRERYGCLEGNLVPVVGCRNLREKDNNKIRINVGRNWPFSPE